MAWKGESRRHSLARKGVKTNIDGGRRFDVSNFVARGKLDLKEFPPQKYVGDGKLPNMYWVSISNHYYYFDEDSNSLESITERDPDFKIEGGTVAVFSTFREALEFADKNSWQGDDITIEDRLTGQIWEQFKFVHMIEKEEYETHDDTRWTKEHMKELGVEFE